MASKKTFCARCGNLLVATSESTHQGDRDTAASVTYTFECQPCQLRFEMSQKDMAQPAESPDRRRSARVPVQVPVNLECGEFAGEGTVTDISKGGCAVQSSQRLTVGQLLRVKFPPPTGSVDTLATQKIATVQNVRGDKAGMKFLAFTPEEQTKLTRTVTKSIQFFPPPDKRP